MSKFIIYNDAKILYTIFVRGIIPMSFSVNSRETSGLSSPSSWDSFCTEFTGTKVIEWETDNIRPLSDAFLPRDYLGTTGKEI